MTALWVPRDLLAATGGLLRIPFAASGISIDTRSLRPGDLFVALVGENGDGHEFVADALARGASGAMVHRLPDGLADEAPLLAVADTMRGLRDLATFARARFTGRLVAVTGSVGKTTTKEMLRAILSPQGKTWAAEASHNNHWGVPLTLARMPHNAAFAIAEIGMNHPGEILPLARLARPHVAVVTNVEATHIGHLGSIEAIADEKATILAGLEPGGVAVLPAESAMIDRLRARAGETRLFGRGGDAELVDVTMDADGSVLTARFDDATLEIRLAAPGRHMAMNAVAALLAAAALGADLAVSAAALGGFTPVTGRGARRRIPAGDGTALLLDESYNASAVSVRAALAVLALQPAERRIAVLGDMLELGGDGPREHRDLAAAITADADLMFSCGPLMRLPYDDIPESHRGAHAPDAETLAPIVAGAMRAGDAILVKGSLGSRMRLVVQALEQASG